MWTNRLKLRYEVQSFWSWCVRRLTVRPSAVTYHIIIIHILRSMITYTCFEVWYHKHTSKYDIIYILRSMILYEHTWYQAYTILVIPSRRAYSSTSIVLGASRTSPCVWRPFVHKTYPTLSAPAARGASGGTMLKWRHHFPPYTKHPPDR